MKKEEEERRQHKDEVTLSIPVDHPVRKLFQKFKQQKEIRSQGPAPGPAPSERCQPRSERHHLHLHPCSLQPLQNGTPGNGGSSVVTISQNTPIRNSLVYVHTDESAESPAQDMMELKPSLGGTGDPNCLRVHGHTQLRPCPGRGSARLKGDAGGDERKEEWVDVSQVESMELLSEDSKSQEEGMGVVIGVEVEVEGGEDGESLLHKTDSCDSGITKSDLRIDAAGEARSPLGEPGPVPTGGPRQPSFQPGLEQALHATLQDAKLELRADIQVLGGRMAALEGQVAEILRLLSQKKASSLDPHQTSTPKTKTSRQDIFTVSRPVTPEPERGNTEQF